MSESVWASTPNWSTPSRSGGPAQIPQDSGIATMIAEIEEDSAVQLLLAGPFDEQRDAACARAGALLEGIDAQRRPLAALRATLLLAQCLATLHRDEEAEPRWHRPPRAVPSSV
jgi:hypothetical protein